MKWFLKFYRSDLPGMVECVQQVTISFASLLLHLCSHASQPGEIIWVPSGWWHCVLNLTDTIAVTQNLCNTHNWNTVWPDVLNDRSMVSLLFLSLFLIFFFFFFFG